jgi:hypothetical protein
MASRVKSKPNVLVDEDFYAWSREQAGRLRDGRFADLDLERLIEEVDDLGGALKRSVRGRIRTVIEHLLKLEHAPAQHPRGGWYGTIIRQRSDLVDELTPSMRREIQSARESGPAGHVVERIIRTPVRGSARACG